MGRPSSSSSSSSADMGFGRSAIGLALKEPST